MRNRLLSGWRQYVVYAVVASFALTPVFAGAKDRITTMVDNPSANQGVQLVDPSDQGTVGNVEPATLYARSNYIWPYNVSPPYGGFNKGQLRAQGVLRTLVGVLPIAELQTRLPEELQTINKLDVLAMQYFIIDLDHAWLRQGGVAKLSTLISDAGGEVVGGMPVSAVIARLNQNALIDVRLEPGVKAVVPFQSAFKLHPDIGRVPLANPIKAVSEIYDLDITLFPGENGQVVATEIVALGGEVTAVAGRTIRASLNRAKLGELAAIQAILVIHEAIPNSPAGEETTITIQTGGFQGRATVGPYHLAGINGSGNGVPGTTNQVLMVIDDGVQLDAADLADTDALAGTASGSHRKVVAYRTASSFQGDGDGLGCDAGPQGGLTHGHVVAATALGNATDIVDLSTGWNASVKFFATDANSLDWALDGVAPGAKVSILDAQDTPAASSCTDPVVNNITIGPNYYTGSNPLASCPGPDCPGFLQVGYRTNGGDTARSFNLSYGQIGNPGYGSDTRQIDAFLYDKGDAMVFASAGNEGNDFDADGFPDLGSVVAPSTNKNGLSIGAAGNASLFDHAEIRSAFSSIGPARVDAVAWELDPINSLDRVQPILMAPGVEFSNLGVASEFVCRTNDNDQSDPVECDITDGNAGTSFASPAAAGAGLLVRDYFAQGFYPTGAQVTANAVNISGALQKAILVASADFLNGGDAPGGAVFDTTPHNHRFNNEQGYGRIQLDRALPLQTWAQSVTGLIVADGGIVSGPPFGPNNLSGLDGVLNGTVAGETDSQAFEVCAKHPTLRVALAWMDREVAGDNGRLNTDLDLELVAPSGKTYYGNYFTDDDNRDLEIDPNAEDCPDFVGNVGVVSGSQWSLPICQRGDGTLSPHDVANNTEAIMLSDDSDNDGTTVATDPDPANDDQIEVGTWTITVKVKSTNPGGTAFTPGPNADVSQRYAVAISGAGCLGSSVRFDSGTYVCNAKSTVTVNELAETPSLTQGTISGRTIVEVFDSGNVLVDTETGLGFTKQTGTESYVGDTLFLTDKTARDPGNGVLDVRDGDTLRVTYTDTGTTEISEAAVNCQLRIASGSITFGQFGFDTSSVVSGGCERNARGLFEFGFPDRFPDEGERLILGVAIGSQEIQGVTNISAALRCVEADDALAPADCLPGTTNCDNPNRLITGPFAMTPCPSSDLSITNSPILIQELPANAGIGINYNLVMGSSITDMKEVEFVLELTSDTTGRSGTTTAVFRKTLDADVLAVLYSTDFPTGGSEFADWNNNELLEGNTALNSPPADNAGDFLRDYRFETRVFSDMTAGGKNALAAANAPWNFNTNDGGFTNGIAAPTDDTVIIDTIAQWGEDKNFNNILDGFCAIGHCDVITTQGCNNDSQCVSAGAGTTCLFDAQGWCGGVVSGTQCTDFDDPFDPDLDPEDCEGDANGNTCDLVTCQDSPANCTIQMLVGLNRCISESEDIDPASFFLENVWNTDGGCGWQTADAGSCTGGGAETCFIDADCPSGQNCSLVSPSYGMWHTGRIGAFGATGCLGAGNAIEQCQGIETVGGSTGERLWLELLVTPPIEKVDDTADSVNIVNFAWNQAIDLEDSNVGWTWEVDGDTTAINPVDLTSDGLFLNAGFGGYTGRAGGDGVSENNPDLTNGYSMFAPVAGVDNLTTKGKLGLNRHGQNACYFEGSGQYQLLTLFEFGLAGPRDDDLNNGHCPGELFRMCTEICLGGTQDTLRCSSVGGADAACISGGGVCVNGNPSNIYNNCNVADTCVSNVCTINGEACTVDADCFTCIFDNSTIDEYVTPNGPIRNMDLFAFNGPDLRFTTLEDIAGESAANFQAAIGILNFEKEDTSAPDPETSYGIGVDDVVFEWQEFTIVPDASDCGPGGSCATIDSTVGTSFNSATFLDITVQDATPSDNDCNDDGDNTDAGDDRDCNNNGIADVRIIGKSDVEPTGERITMDCVNPSGSTCPDGEYSGSLPVSATFDSPGVVFVASRGVELPSVTMEYFDFDDGTGVPCQNSLIESENGIIQAATLINLVGGDVALIGTSVTDNGDNDIWADTNETVDMKITLRNQTGILLSNVSVKLATNDPKIDCILNANINIGQMLPDDPATVGIDEGVVTSTAAFTFRIASSANRVGQCSISLATCSQDADCDPGGGTCDAELLDYTAALNLFISSDQFDTVFVDQVTTIPLDLDAFGGGVPTEIIEGFEGGFGIFGINNMDSASVVTGAPPPAPQGIIGTGGAGGSLANSDGYRCQFADPDWINGTPGIFGDPQCFAGLDLNHANDVWWQIITERSFDGTQSLYYGSRVNDIIEWTTPTGIIEGVETISPLAMGFAKICSNAPLTLCPSGDTDCPMAVVNSCIDAEPRAVWKHQVSLIDDRSVNASAPRRTADGTVIMVQLANPVDDSPVGDWFKVTTVANQYDSQREDNFNVCSFDPIDDGNTEDDFFDPTDPFRLYGPSSTCFPEFVYTYMGDTDGAFDPLALGNATQGPGLEGTVGVGTWVESVVDLGRFKAQYVRVRFLAAALKLAPTWQAAFNFDVSLPFDDGWFIDDFRVKDAITSAAVLEGDVKANASVCSGDGTTACVDDTNCAGNGSCQFPQCGVTCNTVTASLVADPADALAAPGQVVELSASASMADRCIGGVLQYRFWIDENGNQTGFEPGTDTLLRDWTENPILLQAPGDTTNFAADSRCSSATSCLGTAYNTVVVACPDSTLLFPTITADGSNNKNDFQFGGTTVNYAFGEGLLSTLSAAYATDSSATGLNAAFHTLLGGDDHWVLFRTDNPVAGGTFCNQAGGPGGYDAGGAPGRDAGGTGLP